MKRLDNNKKWNGIVLLSILTIAVLCWRKEYTPIVSFPSVLRPQCYGFTENGSARLNASVVAMLEARQKKLPNIDDYHDFGVSGTKELLKVSFKVPKIIHQVWIGDRPPPSALLDTWRYDRRDMQ
jgi:hypothetical protein